MSLRVLLFVLFIGVLLLAFGAILPSFIFLREQLAVIFPRELVLEADAALYTLLTAQAIVLISVIAALLAVLFAILSSLVARPLRGVVASMTAFAERGEHLELPSVPSIPKELRTLVAVFSQFVEKVETSHKKDVEVSRVKSDFISTAAHQLRTPLTGIRWSLEALEKSELSEDQKVLVKSARDKNQELVAIVGTLLDISSIESGKYHYDFKPMNLEALAEEVVRDFVPLSQKAEVAVYLERSTEALPQVLADRERIKWILNNLIENAIRYTPAGGSVRIHALLREDSVEMRVRDTGIGIGKEDRDNIFQRFYRAQSAVAKQNGGNGLGLYIARTIANDHKGDLRFTANIDGPGTTFMLTLPVAH